MQFSPLEFDGVVAPPKIGGMNTAALHHRPARLHRLILALGLGWLAAATPAGGAIRTRTVEYRQGGTVLEGILTWDDTFPGPRPGVLVVHQWKGITDFERKRSEMLARLGYAAFAADIYGKGIRPDNAKDAAALAGKYKGDRALLRDRVNAGLAACKAQPEVRPAQVAAIGYCFGGTTVLELARSGAEVAGVVSFHGGLATPVPADARRIRWRVLALHGADDPFVPAAEVAGFQEEMRQASVDWQFTSYGGAVHSFTDWNAGSDNSRGAAYQEHADRRSWEAMKAFLAETLTPSPSR
jgi:dienelactone hydrolase